MSVGKRLKDLRVKTKRTLKEQGETFNVSLNTVYRWEHDLARPRKSALAKIAVHYEVPLEWLLYGKNIDSQTDGDEISFLENNIEKQLFRMYRKLSDSNKFKILGYVERIYIENVDNAVETEHKTM